PPDSTTLNTQGSTIEPNATNTFTNSESGIIAQTIELFNIDTNTMASIITDIDSQKLNTFQIIDK
ncbi:MAG: hypothetical protein GTO02_13430, partial [Candidatus Dadabacteria bacterium]|nr:hypothetical protein [Candidatus Dadabacteria bacterium]